MKGLKEIYNYTFVYPGRTFLVIFCNLMFVVFNLLSLVLFIPFLQLIFEPATKISSISAPSFDGSLIGMVRYVKEYYNYFMQQMVNEDPKLALAFVCISVFSAFLLKNIFRYGAVWHQSELRMAVVRDIRNKLFQKAMQLPLSFYSNERKGDLMARMNSDVGEIEIAVISMLELLFREPIAIIINVGTLIYLSPKLTLISFLLLPISAFVISRIGKSLKRTAKKGQEQMGILFSTIEESLSGIRVIKAFDATKTVYKYFAKVNLTHQQLITKAFRKRDVSPLLNETLGAGVMLGLVWFGGMMILDTQSDSHLTGKVFITFIIVFSQLLRPIQGISTSLANLNKSKASQDRINEILEMDEQIYESLSPSTLEKFQGEIRFKEVHFKYKDEYVLRDISFELKKGQTIALVGESGSGKSTIGDLLCRFYDVSEGKIEIDGIPLKDIALSDLRKEMSVVSQESVLFNATVAENIAFGNPNAPEAAIIEAAKIANAHEFIENLENGYQTNIGERGNKLSGGQKQRIAIARALLRDSSILILDEATSALDTESEKYVQDALNNLMKDRTAIVIAHRLSTIRNADSIIVLSKGRIIEQGTHDELLQLKGHYFKLCSLQGMETQNNLDF